VKTELDEFADRGREALLALAPIVFPTCTPKPDDPDWGREIVFSALVALMHYCIAAEVDFGRELASARDLVALDREEDFGLESEGGDA
jgi:hypothetical protein